MIGVVAGMGVIDESRISGKGVHMYMYKGVVVHFADFIFFLKYPMKMK